MDKDIYTEYPSKHKKMRSWMDLEGIMLSVINQIEKDKYDFTHV